jgi:hypothetical protein
LNFSISENNDATFTSRIQDHDCSCNSNGKIINFWEKFVFFAELLAASRQPLYFSAPRPSPLAPKKKALPCVLTTEAPCWQLRMPVSF